MNFIKTNRKKILEAIFLLGLLIELVIVISDKSAWNNPYEGKLFQLTFLLFFIKAVLTQYTKKEYIIAIFCGVIGVISFVVTDRNDILRIVMFVIASKNVSLRKSLILTFYATLVGVMTLVLLSLTGVLGEIAITTVFRDKGVETRYCLGIGHPNALHCMAWVLTTLGLYLYEKQTKIYHYIILFILNCILYYFTVSRTGILITAFTIIATAIFHYNRNLFQKKIISDIGIVMLLAGVIFSVLIAKFGVDYFFIEWLDQKLTGRFWDAYFHGNSSLWSLFSSETNIKYFDMGFIRLFYWYGFVPAILYIVVNVKMIIKSYREEDKMAFMLIMMFTIYTVVEAHPISVYLARNYILLLLINNWQKLINNNEGLEQYWWKIYRFWIPEANEKGIPLDKSNLF